MKAAKTQIYHQLAPLDSVKILLPQPNKKENREMASQLGYDEVPLMLRCDAKPLFLSL